MRRANYFSPSEASRIGMVLSPQKQTRFSTYINTPGELIRPRANLPKFAQVIMHLMAENRPKAGIAEVTRSKKNNLIYSLITPQKYVTMPQACKICMLNK
jgi:hypothetical protein